MLTPVILFCVFVLYRFIMKKPLDFPIASALSLAAFGAVYVYSFYDPEHSFYFQSFTHIQAVLFLIMGYNFFRSDESLENRFKKLETYFLIIAIMYMVYVSLTYGFYLKDPANAPSERHYWSIWYPGEIIKAATGFSTSLLFAVVWGSFSLFFSEKWYKKCLGVVLIAYAVAFNIATGTRLLVYLTPVILVAEFFVWIVFHKKKYKLGIGITFGLIALIGAAVLVLVLNKDRLSEKYGGSVLERFFTMGFGSPLRWSYLKHVIENFSITYTGGGVNSKTFGTPHNIWFYVYDYGGIQSFVLYCVFTLITAVNFIRFLANKHVPTNIKFFIATLFGTVFVEFMLEDLILPLPSYYILAMFIVGLFGGLAAYKPKTLCEKTDRLIECDSENVMNPENAGQKEAE